MFCYNGSSNGIGGGPGGLEIEATCDTVDIEHLASEIKVGMLTALKCYMA